MKKIRWRGLVLLCWLFCGAPAVFSTREEGVEYPVKLAFLYNFGKFVEWPAGSFRSPSASLTICVVGHDPFTLQSEGDLRTRAMAGHPVEVLLLKTGDGMSGCHMVFIPVTEKDQGGKIVKDLKGLSALTVGESEGFAMQGGMINLTVEGNKVHFEVNPLAAERAGLKISSKLLSLAKIVRDDSH